MESSALSFPSRRLPFPISISRRSSSSVTKLSNDVVFRVVEIVVIVEVLFFFFFFFASSFSSALSFPLPPLASISVSTAIVLVVFGNVLKSKKWHVISLVKKEALRKLVFVFLKHVFRVFYTSIKFLKISSPLIGFPIGDFLSKSVRSFVRSVSGL